MHEEDYDDLKEYVEGRIIELKEVVIEAQEEKIKAKEDKRKPSIMTDSIGNMNTEETLDNAIILHCDYICDIARSQINELKKGLERIP